MLLSIDLPQYTTILPFPLPLLTVGLMPQTMKATNDMFNFFDLLLNKMENIIKSFNHASHAGHAADQRTHPPTGPWWLGPVVHSSICSFTHPFIHSDNHSTVAPPNFLRARLDSLAIFECAAHSCDLDGPLLWLRFLFYMPQLPWAITTTTASTTTTVMRVTRATKTLRTTVEKHWTNQQTDS